MEKFNPNGVGLKNGNIFGLPFSVGMARLVILPAPWGVTTSLGEGTEYGPASILEASRQIDFHDPYFPNAWKEGIAMIPVSQKWLTIGHNLRQKAKICIQSLENGGSQKKLPEYWEEINEGCVEFKNWIRAQSLELICENKTVGILGGDHSSSLGLIQALTQLYDPIDVLQIDAHLDLREEEDGTIGYEGFSLSHASAMRNAAETGKINLTQVGIRDCSDEEVEAAKKLGSRIFFDSLLKDRLDQGESWHEVCQEIIDPMSEYVYVSCDVDGLDQALFPNTGTPVPGGLSFWQFCCLLRQIIDSGRTIIAFDLCEVAPANDTGWEKDLNALNGMRVLYQLAILTLASQK